MDTMKVRDQLEKLAKAAKLADAARNGRGRAIGREINELMDTLWVSIEASDGKAAANRVCELMACDVEFSTGYHIIFS